MAAIAKFVSYDGGMAFSDRSFKIQKREDAEGRIIPISDVLAVKVQKPTSEDEGYVFVQVAGERSSQRNVVYYEDQQVGEAVRFKRAFDSYRSESKPQERRQPYAGDARTPGRGPGRQTDDGRRSNAGKKGKIKKIIIGVAVFYAVLMVVGAIALLFDGDKADSIEDTHTTSEPAGDMQTQQQEVHEQDATPEHEQGATSVVADVSEPTASAESVTLEDICALLELTVSGNFEHYTITPGEPDDNSITVSLWQDGVALEVAMIQSSGGGADNANWVYLKNSFVSLSSSMRGVMQGAGRADVNLYMNILNDQNTDNTLLSIVNSVVYYDVLA